MENGVMGCWLGCLPPCVSRKKKCPCHALRRHRNRISPSKPVEVIVTKGVGPIPATSTGNPHTKLNGETNLYFKSDEVTFCAEGETYSNCDSHSNGRPSSLLNGDCSRKTSSESEERVNIGEQPESEPQGFYEFLSTIFLQLSKTKQLRVIHIKSKTIVGGPLSVQNLSRDNVDGVNSSSDSEDEDYWFTNWSRRPKLKNTFSKSKKHNQPQREVIIEVNSRTTFTYEEIQNLDEKKSEESKFEKKLLRKTCSSPALSFSHSYSVSPPPSPILDNAILNPASEVLSSQRLHRTSLSEECCAEWTPNEEVQLEVVDSNTLQTKTNECSSSSFTNFAFQLEPEDGNNIGDLELNRVEADATLHDESHKTEPGILFDIQQNGHCPLTPPSLPPLSNDNVSGEPIKSNGFLRSFSSPSRMETLLERNEKVPSSEEPSSPSIDNSKPLLFFIHGISGSSDIWKSQFHFFHELGYEIVAPDLLGHGLSSTPNKAKHYLFESLVQDLVNVFDHFASESRVSVVIAHGYGACMGSVLSRIRSENISLLISVSGGGPTPLIPFGRLERPLLPFRLNLFNKKKSIGRFDNPDLKHVLPDSIHKHILDGQLWVDGDAAFHRRISVPTLLVHGLRDTVVSLIEECEMERTIPKAFLELLPRAGHMVMWDEPKKLNRMLIKFIQAWT